MKSLQAGAKKRIAYFGSSCGGGSHAFKANTLQAYHLVAEKTVSPGPRPSTYRRIVEILGALYRFVELGCQSDL
jgi:hypothetical protein